MDDKVKDKHCKVLKQGVGPTQAQQSEFTFWALAYELYSLDLYWRDKHRSSEKYALIFIDISFAIKSAIFGVFILPLSLFGIVRILFSLQRSGITQKTPS